MDGLPPKLSQVAIGCSMRVHGKLGFGFLEKVYENALVIELRKAGLHVEQQKRISIFYEGQVVGEYIADLVVEGKLLLELKAISSLADEHTAVCIHYLRATNLPVCLLVNFGRKSLEWKRIVGDSYIHEKDPI